MPFEQMKQNETFVVTLAVITDVHRRKKNKAHGTVRRYYGIQKIIKTFWSKTNCPESETPVSAAGHDASNRIMTQNWTLKGYATKYFCPCHFHMLH